MDASKFPTLTCFSKGVRYVEMFMLFLCFVVAYILVAGLSVAAVIMSETNELDWSTSAEGLVLDAFLWGFCISPIIGGWLCHIIGAKLMLTLSITLSSIMAFLLPTAAYNAGWIGTCCVRVAQGLFQGVLAPGCHALLATWVPPMERSRLGSLVYGGAQLGTMFGLLIGGFLCDSSWGWPSVFYVSGALGLLWSLLWIFIGSNAPDQHSKITQQERDYIERNIAGLSSKNRVIYTPWRTIFKSPALWGLTAAHCGQMVGYWTLLTELPTYMEDVQGFNIQQNGLVTALPYFAMWAAALPQSYIADKLVKNGKLSIGCVRKVANSIAQYGGGAMLVVIGTGVADDNATLTVVLLTIAMTLLSSMYLAFQINHLDISPNHAAALVGFTNLCANFLSVLGPIITSLVVTDQSDADQWHIVFLGAGIFFLITNTLFLVFGSGNIQPWNDLGVEVGSRTSFGNITTAVSGFENTACEEIDSPVIMTERF